ncbi:hypothetical protein ACQKWADRAFT_298779, partial [Trichoderma austrokoningii]
MISTHYSILHTIVIVHAVATVTATFATSTPPTVATTSAITAIAITYILSYTFSNI